jgi:hypothetical protein
VRSHDDDNQPLPDLRMRMAAEDSARRVLSPACRALRISTLETSEGIIRMALTGIHVFASYIGPQEARTGAAQILGEVAWSQTMASPGTTTQTAPQIFEGGRVPVFGVIASADCFIAVGQAPDATSGARVFVPAREYVHMYVEPGDKLAWVAA